MNDKTGLYISQSKGIGLMKYAPILIPTLCRADKFRKCIESLKKINGLSTRLYMSRWITPQMIHIGVDIKRFVSI